MSVPYTTIAGVKIAAFKYQNSRPYGIFINTTEVGGRDKDYRIQQTIQIHQNSHNFNWPSSEHAYHAQKIIFAMNKLPANHAAQAVLFKMLMTIQHTNKTFLPRDDYDPLIQNNLTQLQQAGLQCKTKFAFDAFCEADYHATKNPTGGKRSREFMREVLQLKFNQHPEVAELAVNCARQGILPIEVSRYDMNWASGPNGLGANQLGIMILEEGNRLLQERTNEKPAIPNPENTYRDLQRQHQSSLTHDALVNLIPSTRQVQPQPYRPSVSQNTLDSNVTYYESRGGNQRLVIQNNRVVGYEFRKSGGNWQKSGDKSRFQNLENAYISSQQAHHSLSQTISSASPNSQDSNVTYYESRKKNQRLVILNNQVIGYEFLNRQVKWEMSSDPKRFRNLEDAFVKSVLKSYYFYATTLQGRTHFWSKARSKDSLLTGDALKSKILLDFKAKIDACETLEALRSLENQIRSGTSYKILSQSQGLWTKVTKGKTSSVEALEKMFDEKRNTFHVPRNH